MSYVLVTPIKNERDYIAQLKNTIFAQTRLPAIWVIVDSGSSDGGLQLLREAFADTEWIHVIQQRVFWDQGYSHRNFAQAVNEGLEYARKTALSTGVHYEYVGKTDATPFLSHDYFEELIKELNDSSRIALACGIERFEVEGRKAEFRPIKGLSLTGFNDIRLYNRTFLECVGGYPITYSPDAVLLVKAVSMGWEARVVDRTCFEKNRLGGLKLGIWRGYRMKGAAMYALGYHPLLVLLNSADYSIRYHPHVQGAAIIYGYLGASLLRIERVKDQDVLEFYGSRRLKEIIHFAYLKIIGRDGY